MQVQLAPQRGGMELFWRLHIRSNTKRHPLCWCAFLMFTRTAPVPQDTHYNRCNCSFWVRTPSPAKVVLNIIFHSPKKIPFILSLPRQLYWLSHDFLPSVLCVRVFFSLNWRTTEETRTASRWAQSDGAPTYRVPSCSLIYFASLWCFVLFIWIISNACADQQMTGPAEWA